MWFRLSMLPGKQIYLRPSYVVKISRLALRKSDIITFEELVYSLYKALGSEIRDV